MIGNQTTTHETKQRRAPARRSTRGWAILAVSAAAAVGVVGLAGCGTGKAEVGADLAGSGPSTAVGAGDHTATFAFSGQPERFTVPAGVTSLSVDVAGGAGGGRVDSNPHKDPLGQAGAGYEVSGSLAVAPGDQLTIAVGGGGGLSDGNKNPGAGGWGFPSLLAGGTGGGGHSGGADGSGGGGASTIIRDSHELIVAGGGGGMGGAATIGQVLSDPGQKGGNAGNDWGEDGYAAAGQTGGRGAHNELYNSHGGSATSGVAGGGGGGGGGYYPGEGGTKGVLGGGGGGGGNSYTVLLTNKTTSLNTTRMANGFVKLAWVPDYSGEYAFQKTGSANPQLLEDNNNSTEQGAVIDTWEPVRDGETLAANYRWDYQYLTGKNAGVLRNQSSGLCLEVNGSDGKIDQWPCDSDAANHLWRIVPASDGNVAVMVVLGEDTAQWKPGTYYLATTNNPDSITNGAQLTLNPDITDSRSQWQSPAAG